MATIRSISDLLYLFRDGQAPKSIGSQQFQDLIASLHLASGNFQDLPTSAAGLPSGRIYLNGDTLQISAGGVPGLQSAHFSASGAASMVATARARRAARVGLAGSGSITATPSFSILFEDLFNSLSLMNQFANQLGSGPFSTDFSQDFFISGSSSSGIWYPSQFWAPDNAGYVINNSWILNPFNSATPIAGSYAVGGGNLALLMQNTPSQYLSACGGKPYIGTQLVAPFVATFGRFEARLSVPGLNGTECAFFLISNSGGATPVTTEIDVVEIVTSSGWSPRVQWSTSIKPPGYPPGVGNVAEFYSYNPGAPVIDPTQMNTYAVDVRQTYVAVSVNGVEVMRTTPPAEFGNTPWCIYLGQGDGGGWTGPMDASPAYAPMLVDYVRVTP